jgi:hypothetical protein
VADGPLFISVRVGTFQGANFEGPVTIALKPEGQTLTEEKTVKFDPAERAWATTLTPREAGPHVLEVAFRTTRLKVLRATFDVSEAKLSRWLAYLLAAAVLVVGLGLGTRLAFKRGA